MVHSRLTAVELVAATHTSCYPLRNPFDDFYPDDMSAPEDSGLSTLMACDPDWGWIVSHQSVVTIAAAKLLESMSSARSTSGGDWISCEFKTSGVRFVMASRGDRHSRIGAIALMETVPSTAVGDRMQS